MGWFLVDVVVGADGVVGDACRCHCLVLSSPVCAVVSLVAVYSLPLLPLLV